MNARMPSSLRRLPRRLLRAGLGVGLVLSVPLLHAGAVTDGTVGRAGVTLSGNFTVPPSLGTQRGGNLFQSFQRFGIQASESATFLSGDASVRNVIVRVTGGLPTKIDGPLSLLAPAGSAPGFWFMNPSGITIGTGGTFDVPGSLHLSTAAALQFADGTRWLASTTGASTLTAAEPRAFGFVGSTQAAPLVWNGVPGEDAPYAAAASEIELSAGTLTLDGAQLYASPGGIRLTANGGDIVLRNGSLLYAQVESKQAVAGPAMVLSGRDITVQDSRLVVRTDGPEGSTGGTLTVAATGNFSLRGNSQLGVYAGNAGDAGTVSITAVDVLLAGSADGTAAVEAYGDSATASAGTIVVRASGAMQMLDGGYLFAAAKGSGKIGLIDVQAASLRIDGEASGLFGNSQRGSAAAGGTGTGANILVTTDRLLSVDNKGWITSDTETDQDGGDITIHAGSMTLARQGSVQANTRSSGRGGAIDITVGDTLDVSSSAYISTNAYGSGRGGSITIEARQLQVSGADSKISSSTLKDIDITDSERGGDITVATREALRLLDGAVVSSSTESARYAGFITLRGGGTVEILGGSQVLSQSRGVGEAGLIDVQGTVIRLDGKDTGVKAEAGPNSRGDAGYISLGDDSTRSLTVSAGAQVSIGTQGAAGQGQLALLGRTISLSQGAVLNSNASGRGPGGSITVGNANTAALTLDNATLQSDTQGSGNAGYIQLTGGTLGMSGDSKVLSTSTGTGEAGYITIAGNSIRIEASKVIAESGPLSRGTAGYVDLGSDKTSRLTLVDSEVSVLTKGAAGAGRIRLQGDDIRLQSSIVDASSDGSGKAGDVKVTAKSLALDVSTISSSASELATGEAGSVSVAVSGPVVLRSSDLLAFNDSEYADNKPELSGVDLSAGSLLLQDSQVLADARGGANGAHVSLNITGATTLLDDSRIGTSAVFGSGGPVTVISGGTLLLQQSQISTSVEGLEFGRGGNITVLAPTIVMRSGFIQANTLAPRFSGGDILITTNLLLPDGSNLRLGGTEVWEFKAPSPAGLNVIQAAAPDGISGQLSVAQPELNVAGALASLQAAQLGSGRLAYDLCEIPNQSSLSVLTRGTLYPGGRVPLSPAPGTASTPATPNPGAQPGTR